MQWLLDLCNHCWHTKTVPEEWSTASVAMLFKKGDPADPNNYRPICLQSIAYKLFASLLKQRFLDAALNPDSGNLSLDSERGIAPKTPSLLPCEKSNRPVRSVMGNFVFWLLTGKRLSIA